MKTKTLTPKLLAAAAAAGSLFFSGCLRDENPIDDGSSEGTVLVNGRVQGDGAMHKLSASGAGSTGVEGAVVTVARVNADGSLRTVSTAEVKTDAQGHFSVRAVADGSRELIVRAKQAGQEWKAVVSAKAENGKTVACRPLDMESSLEADVLTQARAGQAGGTASFVDVAVLIDADVAAQAEAKPEAKADFEAFLAAQIRTEAKVRGEALMTGAAKASQAQIDNAEEARLEAEAKLESDLNASADLSAAARANLEAGFKQAEHQAWIDAGLTLEAATVARESCYQAMVKTGAQASVDADAKALWLRKIALEHASEIEIAVDAGLQAKGGNAVQVNGAAAAGAALVASLKSAGSETSIDSAFLAFRSSCSAMQIEIPGLAPVSHAGSDTTGSQGQAGVEATVESRIIRMAADEGKASVVTQEEVKAEVDSGVAAEVSGNDSAIAHVLAGMDAAANAKGSLLVTVGAEAQDSAAAKARSLEVYAQALERFTVGLSLGTEFRLVKTAHAAACVSLRAAAEGSAKAAGASDAALSALAQAGAALQVSIAAALNTQAIASAYTNYHAAMTACLKSAVALQASNVEKADSSIRAEGGARAALLAKLAAAADADAAAKAQVEFAAQVDAEVKAAFGTGMQAPSDAQMHAIVQALVLANMCD
ncbi:MAG: carboxypeptidase regulatory-like domain-containing protein [Fibrobacteres bacterium]|nr:carboxypeptidase regulatory-like domain-containing protein [Fibrobacterota bacterium]